MVLTTFTKHRGFQTEEHDIGHRKSQGAREKDWLRHIGRDWRIGWHRTSQWAKIRDWL